MDIRHLKYFIAIVENDNNLHKTAEKMYVSISFLSQLISNFEGKEKVKLFDRKSKKLHLTQAGSILYEEAQKLLSSYDSFHKNFREKNQKNIGKLKIGITPLFGSLFADTFIPEFYKKHGNISLEIVEKGSYELSKLLLLEEIEAALLVDPISNIHIEKHKLFEDSLVCITSYDHKFAKQNKKSISLQDISEEKLVLFDKSFVIYHIIINALNLENPNIFFTTSQWDLICKMVEKENLISFLPKPLIDKNPHFKLKTYSLNPNIPWTMSYCNLKDKEPSMASNIVFEELQNYFKNLS
jgi:DNA-binding transcriptional LysR family regulator